MIFNDFDIIVASLLRAFWHNCLITFCNDILELQKLSKMEPKRGLHFEGLPLSGFPSPPLGLSPSITTPEGDPLQYTFSTLAGTFRNLYGQGDRKAPMRVRVEDSTESQREEKKPETVNPR